MVMSAALNVFFTSFRLAAIAVRLAMGLARHTVFHQVRRCKTLVDQRKSGFLP